VNVIQWNLYYPARSIGGTGFEASANAGNTRNHWPPNQRGRTARGPQEISSGSSTGFAGRSFVSGALLLSWIGGSDVCRIGSRCVGWWQQSGAGQRAATNHCFGQIRDLVPNQSTQSLATEFLAGSYYQQSRGNLPAALTAARKAAEKSPTFGFAWERVAELEFSFGHTDAALEC